MDRISPHELAEWQIGAPNFHLARRAAQSGARRRCGRPPECGVVWIREQLFAWKDQIPRDRPAVVYCAKGHEISQGVAATLCALGLDARYLVDGYAGWRGRADAGK